MPESARSPGPVLRLDGVRLTRNTEPINETVHAGQILGLAGLEGHGQEQLLQSMCGLLRSPAGRVVAVSPDGREVPLTSMQAAADLGIVYLARDRKTEGILGSLSVLDNFAVSSLRKSSILGFIRGRHLTARYAAARQRLDIVTESPRTPITALSGGNQQKVLLARILELSPRLMLLNDPTRGLDHPSKQEFYDTFRTLAERDGVAITILSTELSELVALCSRVLVFHRGSVAVACGGADITEQALLDGMFGAVSS